MSPSGHLSNATDSRFAAPRSRNRAHHAALTAGLRQRELDAEDVWKSAQPLSGLSEQQFTHLYDLIGRRVTWQLWQIALYEAASALRGLDSELALALGKMAPALRALVPAEDQELVLFEEVYAMLREG